MINNLTLNNFQSHVSTNLEFSPFYNVIFGETGHGKSAIVRAIRLLSENRPSGNDFVTRPDGLFSEIVMRCGRNEFRRVKGPKINKYSLNSSEYSDFGTEIPIEISKELPLKRIDILDDESFFVQLSRQFDPLFLVTCTNSIKAKFINRISGAYIIDDLIKEFNHDIKELKSEINDIDNRINEFDVPNLSSRVVEYQFLVKEYKEIYSRIMEEKDKVVLLNNFRNKLYNWRDNNLKIERTKSIIRQIDVSMFIDKIKRFDSLTRMNARYNTIMGKLEEISIVSKSIKEAERLKLIDKVVYINKLYNIKNKIEKNNLYNTETGNKIQRIREDVVKLEKEIGKIKICPTCKRAL